VLPEEELLGIATGDGTDCAFLPEGERQIGYLPIYREPASCSRIERNSLIEVGGGI
jgi:hypothetical protein